MPAITQPRQASPADVQAKLAAAKAARQWEGLTHADALADVKDLLGVRLPVKVHFNNRLTRTRGRHGFDVERNEHVLTFGRGHTVASANSTLIHELVHCAQQERMGVSRDDFLTAYHAERRVYGYRAMPMEREARDMADYIGADYQVTR